MLLKHAESIGIEHLCPLIAVIACCIAASHDMRELYRHTSIGQLREDHRLLPSLLLEGNDIVGKCLLFRVVGHIEQSEADLPHTSIGHVEVSALHDALYQLIRQWFTRLIMEGEGTQEVLLDGKVLHELRR